MSDHEAIEAHDKEDLQELLDDLAHNTKVSSKQNALKAFFEKRGISPEVSGSSCRGGTQQVRNRVGQDGVQQSPQLAFFFIKETDKVQPITRWLEECIRGETTTPRPTGPIAIAQPIQRKEGGVHHEVVAIVAARETPASYLVGKAYNVEPIDPLAQILVILPSGASCFRVEIGQDETMDSFTLTSNRPKGGDMIAFVSESGLVEGVGQVDRVAPNGRVAMRRLHPLIPGFPKSEVPSGDE